MANNREQDRITGKIILKASLRNDTPLLIGRGGGDAVDIEVMRLPDGMPYIPGSSIAGSLRSFLNGQDGYFWGKTGKGIKHPLQSHIRFEDLIPEEFSDTKDIAVRDGVKIDSKTGTAEEGSKYDYQIVESGLSFPFSAEVTLRDSMEEDVDDFVALIKSALEHSAFRVGANTNTGFGKLTCNDFQAYFFQFPKHADAWFKYLDNGTFSIPSEEVKNKDLPEKDSFSIQATFQLKSSLMIGAYGTGNGDEPDKSQLKSRHQFVLPGKSIRGAIRHRAAKIWNIWGTPPNKFEDLFGIVDEEQGIQKRSRLRIEEFLFEEKEVEPMIQNRIRIDRFTGGVISGALFNSEPVWTTGQERIQLTFTILKDAAPDEKKLLLLLLKDLWLEDLAIGGEKNVGRGILVGQESKVYNGDKLEAAFKRDGKGSGLKFTKGSPEKLNQLCESKTETV